MTTNMKTNTKKNTETTLKKDSKTEIETNDFYIQYSLDHIFIDALYNQCDLTSELSSHLLQQYGISEHSKFLILGIFLGKSFTEDWQSVKQGLETFEIQEFHIDRQVICLPMDNLILCVLYPMINWETYHYFQRKVHNEWSIFAPECSIFIGELCVGLSQFSTVLTSIISQLEWNLVLGPRVLINKKKMGQLHITPLRYPTELDGEVEKALLQKDTIQFNTCFRKLWGYCRQELHTPDAIKSACVRYAIVISHIARINNYIQSELELQTMLKVIANAVYWSEIWDIIQEFAVNMLSTNEQEKAQSLIIIETRKLMGQYYNTGITLEEIANKLHVTEEYLSTIFKKETGMTFSETIRNHRIAKVKELLHTTSLKVNDIAQLAGYSDGKYMSRVFKEIVGMSPGEYRKARAD